MHRLMFINLQNSRAPMMWLCLVGHTKKPLWYLTVIGLVFNPKCLVKKATVMREIHNIKRTREIDSDRFANSALISWKFYKVHLSNFWPDIHYSLKIWSEIYIYILNISKVNVKLFQFQIHVVHFIFYEKKKKKKTVWQHPKKLGRCTN